MSSLNTSSNGPNISRSYQNVVNAPPPTGLQAASPTYGQWAIFTVAAPLVSAFQHDGGKESILKVQSTGEGELVDLVDEFSDGRIQFAFVKVKDPNTTLPKCVLIAWCGEGVPERTKGYFGSHLGVVSKLLHGYHVQVTARSDADLTPERIVQKVADASGSKYAGGPAMPSSAASKPPVASKPVFTPTQVGGGGTAFNPLGRSRAKPQSQHVDEDGWGTDAPQVTRTQLEKVQPAYQPTKVNMAELTSQRREPSRVQATPRQDESSDVVKGGYQPVGKVDIAALRRGAKSSAEDRPIPVKGAYEPTGKVDIAAIRAKAQAGPPSRVSPAATGVSSRGDDDEMPRPLADRSSAFTQSERLTSMPKPKVGNKFGASASFAGTKAPSPAGFGAKPVASAAPVGSASKTFADEGGKTPAQIWAEKKAREGGGAKSPTAAAPSPMPSQPSGDGGWKSGYTGKSWAPVQTTRTGQSDTGNLSNQPTGEELPEEEPTSPAGGVGVLKDRFKGAVPMGAPSARPVPEPQAPPPMDFSSKPNAGARGVPIPGLPSRSTEPEDEVPAEQHQRLPSPPRQPRNPSPESAGSPVRIAMPVARTAEPELSPPAEPEQALPIRSLDKAAQAARGILPEPPTQAEDPARGAAEAAAASTFGRAATRAEHGGGKRAVVQYDYEKAEDNEIELREGEQVTNIDMVDDDWWMGQNSAGETGLFPSNYVELVEEDDHAVDEQPPPPLPAHPNVAQHDEVEEEASVMPAQTSGATATALYDYDAAEDNELSFPEGAKIEGVEFPDEDWWLGSYDGRSGLFPANYVQLDE